MKLKLHDFQSNAVRSVLKEFKQADRAKVIMPCGTGKSIVGVHVVKRMAPKRVLVVAPSLALVKQLLDTYAEQIGLPRVLVVCSDDSTAKEAREKFEIPGVTTDAGVIAAELRKQSGLIVFSTYQSSPRIAESFAAGKVPSFDLAVFDEAHHMAGGSKAFTTPLDDSRIKIRKRLFMTATPRVATQSAKDQAEDDGYEFASMDDESRFGREAFYMSFNTAIDGGHLTDYQVAIFVVKESELESLVNGDEDAKETAKRVALIRAMQEHDIRKVLAYHRLVRQMDWFSEIGLRKTFDAFKESEQVTGSLWSGALDGSDPVSIRRSTLNHFASLNGDSRAVLNNCRVLQEGVDCPSVDAVCLIEPRTQPVDIVQIVGRAIRKSANKKVATIILPVFMPRGVEDDVESFIKSSDFAPVWDVISAIKSHDDRVQGWVSSAGSFSGSASKSHIKFNINLPSGIQGKFYEAIESRIVNRFCEQMPLTEEMIWVWMQDYFENNGRWPKCDSDEMTRGGTWKSIHSALFYGSRGLGGGSSLKKLRTKKMGVPQSLTEDIVWKWMLDFHTNKGRWPHANSGEISPLGTWRAVQRALQHGRYGLRGDSSLAKLRRARLGESDRPNPSNLTEAEITEWAQEHFDAHGKWPGTTSDRGDSRLMTWREINRALETGRHGLPGGDSLSRLVKRITGKFDSALSEDIILGWVVEYHERTGAWPSRSSSEQTPGGSWSSLDQVLRLGGRGLQGGSSLLKLKESLGYRVSLTEDLVFQWMQRHFSKFNEWPKYDSVDPPSPGWSWLGVDNALRFGRCGLPGGSSIAKLRYDMVGNPNELTESIITEMIQGYFEEHNKWPSKRSGETQRGSWRAINAALCKGGRGLPGGSSLQKLRLKMLAAQPAAFFTSPNSLICHRGNT